MVPRFKPSLCFRELMVLFRSNKGMVAKFEKEFAQKFEAVDAVAFPYGRSAQWAFLKAQGIENAEIIMPSYTCSVVAHAVSLSGNSPQFVDIDLHDYNMNLEQAESLINEKTRGIIATHTFGYPQDLERLERIVENAEKRYGHKIWLMQDCCHAFGAQWRGRSVGTSGDVAIYAFNISKIITSIFGGMLTFQSQDLADKVRKWRDSNFRKPGFLKSAVRRFYLLAVYFAFNPIAYRFTWWLQNKTPLLNRLTKAYHLDEKIHFPPDYLDEMMDVEAAVGLVQLRKYSRIIDGRIKKAKWYERNLEKREGWEFPPIVEGATYSHYTVRVPNRNEIIEEFAQKGIHLGKLIQYSIPDLSCYNSSRDYPHSNRVCKQTINFPLS
jgi:perosamine synthetase